MSKGQSTVEFSLVIVVFLIGIFSVITAAMWGVTSDAAISTATEAVELASAASTYGSTSADTNLAALFPIVQPQLEQASWGTPTCTDWIDDISGSSNSTCGYSTATDCDITSPKQVDGGAPELEICVYASASGFVTVCVAGYTRSLVPFGLLGGQGIPIQEFVMSRAIIYQKQG